MTTLPGGSTPPAPRSPAGRPRERRRTAAWWMFHSHLWLGVLVSALTLLISVTGVLLNHKRALGLMPDVEHEPTGALEESMPLAALLRAAEAGVPAAVAKAGVDRMDIRPGDGTIKVRFDDPAVTEVTLDLHSGAVLTVGERNDVFLEKLHSGEIFGDGWILLSDLAAIALGLLVVSGYWIWLYPRSRL